MRFGVAAALLLSSQVESADKNFPSKRILSKHQRRTLRGEIQQISEKGKPGVRKFIRRLANKRKEQEVLKLQFGKTDKENSTLDLGVLANKRHHERILRETIFDKDSVREPFREEVEDEIKIYKDTVLDELRLYCDVIDENNKCDCGNFDFEAINGTIQCTYSASDGSDICQTTLNYCGEPVEICYRQSISFEAAGPEDYSYTYCQTYTKPYQQHVCTTFNHVDEYYMEDIEVDNSTSTYFESAASSSMTCSVQFNDMECNSCSTLVKTTERTAFNPFTNETEVLSIYEERCFLIDCSNTGDKENIVNTCDSGLPTTLKETVIFGDDCSRCQPCGLGYQIENLDAVGYFPLIGEYQCSGLGLAAKIGFFDRKLCPEIQEKTAEYCGCEPLFFDPTLVWTPPVEQSSRTKTLRQAPGPLVLLPGDTVGAAACDVCGSRQAVVAQPIELVTLPNGVLTSCAALQAAGRLGMFSPTYCLSEVMPLVFDICGGCYHDVDVNLFEPPSMMQQSTPEETEVGEKDNIEEDANDEEKADGAIMNATTPNFVVGEGLVSCSVCESGSILSMPENTFTLSNETISCQDFEERLINTAVTETFCLEEASVIADDQCGGCVSKPVADLSIIYAKSLPAVPTTRVDTHKESPDELDVSSDPESSSDSNSNSIESDRTNNDAPWVDSGIDAGTNTNKYTNSALSEEASSSQSQVNRSKTLLAIQLFGAISYSILIYLS